MQRFAMIDLGFALEGAPDYWYDVGCAESRRRLTALDDAAWADLAATWRTQTPLWQERLAYVLGEDRRPREVELLIDLFTDGHADASGLAADALLHDVPLDAVRTVAVMAWAARGRQTARLAAARTGPSLLGEIQRSARR